MMTIAGLAVPKLFDRPKRRELIRPPVRTTASRLQEETDLGESIARGVHAIFAPVRMYICVTMEPKREALEKQRSTDRQLAAGMFEVDEMWSAAAVNARWARRAMLTDERGEVIERAVSGARGMTDAGAREVFFEFNALDMYPERLYLGDGEMRVRIK